MIANSAIHEVLGWIQTNAHQVFEGLLPGATDEQIERFQSESGLRLDSSTRELFKSINGEMKVRDGVDSWSLLPAGFLFSIDEVVRLRQGALRKIVATTNSGKAGELAEEFLPAFLPIAGIDGDYLYVDLRPGADRGCVGFWSADFGHESSFLWANVEALFGQLLDALTRDEPLMDFKVEVDPSGAIEWIHIAWIS